MRTYAHVLVFCTGAYRYVQKQTLDLKQSKPPLGLDLLGPHPSWVASPALQIQQLSQDVGFFLNLTVLSRASKNANSMQMLMFVGRTGTGLGCAYGIVF